MLLLKLVVEQVLLELWTGRERERARAREGGGRAGAGRGGMQNGERGNGPGYLI